MLVSVKDRLDTTTVPVAFWAVENLAIDVKRPFLRLVGYKTRDGSLLSVINNEKGRVAQMVGKDTDPPWPSYWSNIIA